MTKSLIFGFNSRLPIGLVLTFYGYSHEVICQMQLLSHGTRAFIYNADGLLGFLVRFDDIHNLLYRANNDGRLDQLKKCDPIDIDYVLKQLKSIPLPENQKQYLISSYPCLYIFLL